MDEYSNFFDFFDLSEDSNQKIIKKKTTNKLKSLHPDESDGDRKKFETAKIARDTLIDKNKREKYKKLGHNKYVNKFVEQEINGVVFKGESLSNSDQHNNSNIDTEELIKFDSDNSSVDTTLNAVNESDMKTRSRDQINNEKSKSNRRFLGLITDNILTILGITILLFLYYAVYVVLGGLAVTFAFLLSLGFFYLFLTIFY